MPKVTKIRKLLSAGAKTRRFAVTVVGSAIKYGSGVIGASNSQITRRRAILHSCVTRRTAGRSATLDFMLTKGDHRTLDPAYFLCGLPFGTWLLPYGTSGFPGPGFYDRGRNVSMKFPVPGLTGTVSAIRSWRLRLPLGALDNRKVPASFSTILPLESLSWTNARQPQGTSSSTSLLLCSLLVW